MGRRRLELNQTTKWARARALWAYTERCNSRGLLALKEDMLQVVPGLTEANFEAVKSFGRTHLMGETGLNLISVGVGRNSKGYTLTTNKQDNGGWIFTQRMPAVRPQVAHLATASSLCVPELKELVESLNGNTQRREYRAAKLELADAEACALHLTRLVEDLTMAAAKYGEYNEYV